MSWSRCSSPSPAPAGWCTRWIHLYENDDETVAMVVRTVAAAFAHVTLWELYANDVLIVASQQPIEPDLARLAARARQPAIAADLERVEIAGAPAFLSLQAMGPSEVRAMLAAGGPLNRDDRPTMELTAPRRFFVGGHAELGDEPHGRCTALSRELAGLR